MVGKRRGAVLVYQSAVRLHSFGGLPAERMQAGKPAVDRKPRRNGMIFAKFEYVSTGFGRLRLSASCNY
jgi:hypothetical protein